MIFKTQRHVAPVADLQSVADPGEANPAMAPIHFAIDCEPPTKKYI